jgi:hypothetical protein
VAVPLVTAGPTVRGGGWNGRRRVTGEPSVHGPVGRAGRRIHRSVEERFGLDHLCVTVDYAVRRS